MRREIVIAVGWLGAVAAAAVVGIATIGPLGGDASGDPPLSQRDIDDSLRELGAQTSTTPSPPAPTGTRSAAPGPTSSPRTASSDASRTYMSEVGGTFWASCTGGLVTINSVSPRQGYRVDGKQLGPAPTAWVNFKLDARHGHSTEYSIAVTCVNGAPRSRVAIDS